MPDFAARPADGRGIRSVRTWLRALRVLLAVGFRASPRSHILLFLVTVLDSLARLGAVFGLKLLAEAVLRRSGTEVIAAALLTALAGGAAQLCRRAYVGLTIDVEEKAGHLIDRRLMALIAGTPSLEHFDSPAYLDQLTMLRRQRAYLIQVTNAVVRNLRVLVELVGSAVLLARLDALLLLLPLFGLGSFLADRRGYAMFERVEQANAPRWRLRHHLFTLATSASAGKELRVFGLGETIIGRHHAVTGTIRREEVRSHWRRTGLRIVGAACFAAGYVGAIALVLLRAAGGTATAGDVVLVAALAAQLNGLLTAAMAEGDRKSVV
jgi:ATP-binding cassette subfamily B protein